MTFNNSGTVNEKKIVFNTKSDYYYFIYLSLPYLASESAAA